MKHKNLFILSLAVVAVLGTSALTAGAFQGDGQTQNNGNPKMQGERPERPDEETRAAIDQALEDNNFEAWKLAIGERPMSDQITQENFSKFSEAHSLKMQGDNEAARNILKELGVKRGHRQGSGGHVRKMMKGDGFTDANGDGVCDNLDLDMQ